MHNFLILDFFNLIKRYTCFLGDSNPNDGEFYSESATRLVNRILKLSAENKIDFIIVCSDLGFNKRANALLGGEYKANRNKYSSGPIDDETKLQSVAAKERETFYINKVKEILQAMPLVFLEVNGVEADQIVYYVITRLKKTFSDSHYYVASTDTDFLQLIDEHTSIINWNKGILNLSNWQDAMHINCEYLKPKDYALLKAMVGDPSDNIKGIKGLGWTRATTILKFLYAKLNKEVTLDSLVAMEAYLREIKDNYNNTDKEKVFLNKILGIIEDNREKLTNNFKVISFEMLETPYVSRIVGNMEAAFSNPIKFDSKIFLQKLKFKERFENEIDYDAIMAKNVNILYMLNKMKRIAESIRKQMADD